MNLALSIKGRKAAISIEKKEARQTQRDRKNIIRTEKRTKGKVNKNYILSFFTGYEVKRRPVCFESEDLVEKEKKTFSYVTCACFSSQQD